MENTLTNRLLGSDQNRMCIICLERLREIRLPCGHAHLCEECTKVIFNEQKPCPTCRKEFTSYYIISDTATTPISFLSPSFINGFGSLVSPQQPERHRVQPPNTTQDNNRPVGKTAFEIFLNLIFLLGSLSGSILFIYTVKSNGSLSADQEKDLVFEVIIGSLISAFLLFNCGLKSQIYLPIAIALAYYWIPMGIQLAYAIHQMLEEKYFGSFTEFDLQKIYIGLILTIVCPICGIFLEISSPKPNKFKSDIYSFFGTFLSVGGIFSCIALWILNDQESETFYTCLSSATKAGFSILLSSNTIRYRDRCLDVLALFLATYSSVDSLTSGINALTENHINENYDDDSPAITALLCTSGILAGLAVISAIQYRPPSNTQNGRATKIEFSLHLVCFFVSFIAAVDVLRIILSNEEIPLFYKREFILEVIILLLISIFLFLNCGRENRMLFTMALAFGFYWIPIAINNLSDEHDENYFGDFSDSEIEEIYIGLLACICSSTFGILIEIFVPKPSKFKADTLGFFGILVGLGGCAACGVIWFFNEKKEFSDDYINAILFFSVQAAISIILCLNTVRYQEKTLVVVSLFMAIYSALSCLDYGIHVESLNVSDDTKSILTGFLFLFLSLIGLTVLNTYP